MDCDRQHIQGLGWGVDLIERWGRFNLALNSIGWPRIRASRSFLSSSLGKALRKLQLPETDTTSAHSQSTLA